MKNLKKLVLVLAVATATTFSSCTKSDPVATVAAITSGSGNITATIAGSAFQSSIVSNISLQGNIVTIQGGDASGRSIQIQIIGLATAPVAGTYKLYDTPGNFTGSAVLVNGVNQTYSSQGCDANLPQTGFTHTGTITFTTLSTAKIEGTFQFNAASLQSCTNSLQVTAGTFSKTF